MSEIFIVRSNSLLKHELLFYARKKKTLKDRTIAMSVPCENESTNFHFNVLGECANQCADLFFYFMIDSFSLCGKLQIIMLHEYFEIN